MEKIIRISTRYGNDRLTSYVDIAKKRMRHHNEIEIWAMGFGITTAVTVAEILKTDGFAIQKDIITSTVDNYSVPRSLRNIYDFTSKLKTENFDGLMAAAAEKEPSNKESPIRVYDGKKRVRYYLALAMRHLKQHDEVELWAHGIDITILLVIAEYLKANGLAIQKKITTSIVDVKKNDSGERLVEKATMEILLGNTANFDELIGRTIYAHSALGLWRVQFVGPTFGENGNIVACSSSNDEKGKVTRLINYLEQHKPMDMGAIIWNSKLYLVGGENPKEPEFPIYTDKDDENGEYLNRRTFVCSRFPNPSFDDEFSARLPFPLPAKLRPLVVPVIKKTGKTVFYVVARTGTFSNGHRADPAVEVFDPAKNTWKKLAEPPYSYRPACPYVAFELELNGWTRIVLITVAAGRKDFYELSFDLKHKKWHKSSICKGLRGYNRPCSMIRVVTLGNNIRIGCNKSYVLAYKFYTEGEDGGYDETRIDVQELGELNPYIGPYWPCEYYRLKVAVSDLGNGEVLLMSSSMHRENWHGPNDRVPKSELDWDAHTKGALVHYYFLKFRVWEISDPSPKKFVAAEAVDWCHRKVRMPEASDVVYNFPMRTGFVL